MKEFVEKLIDILEENQNITLHFNGEPPRQTIDFVKAIEIVNQLAEEYKNRYVSIDVYKQVAWERDVAIDQLRHLDYQLGEKTDNNWVLCSDKIPNEDPLGKTPFWVTLKDRGFDEYYTWMAYWNECGKRWEWEDGTPLPAEREVIAYKRWIKPTPYVPQIEKVGNVDEIEEQERD